MKRQGLSSAVILCSTAVFTTAVLNSLSAFPQGKQESMVKSPVTFNRDIAPIVFRSCTTCHRPGEAGPFPLLTYKDARSHARQIATVTQSKYMPPWLPEPGEFKLADELRLSEKESKLIADWVKSGALEGEPSDLPPQPIFVEGWQLGKPDLILKAETPYQLSAKGTDQYWNFIFRAPTNQTRWLKAMEIHPGDKRVVHHANVL